MLAHVDPQTLAVAASVMEVSDTSLWKCNMSSAAAVPDGTGDDAMCCDMSVDDFSDCPEDLGEEAVEPVAASFFRRCTVSSAAAVFDSTGADALSCGKCITDSLESPGDLGEEAVEAVVEFSRSPLSLFEDVDLSALAGRG